jgi:hypothetical protein
MNRLPQKTKGPALPPGLWCLANRSRYGVQVAFNDTPEKAE